MTNNHAPNNLQSEKNEQRQTGEHLLTKADVARYCRITTRTVDNWLKTGRLPYFKIGRVVRFRLFDIENHFISNFRVERLDRCKD